MEPEHWMSLAVVLFIIGLFSYWGWIDGDGWWDGGPGGPSAPGGPGSLA